MCVKWYLTVVQTPFKENAHRKYLYCFPMASTMNTNHSMVVVFCIANRMEGSLGNMDKVHKKAETWDGQGLILNEQCSEYLDI